LSPDMILDSSPHPPKSSPSAPILK